MKSPEGVTNSSVILLLDIESLTSSNDSVIGICTRTVSSGLGVGGKIVTCAATNSGNAEINKKAKSR